MPNGALEPKLSVGTSTVRKVGAATAGGWSNRSNADTSPVARLRVREPVDADNDIREAIGRSGPAFMQPFFTWLTAKPTDAERPRVHSPLYHVVTAYLSLFAGLAASAFTLWAGSWWLVALPFAIVVTTSGKVPKPHSGLLTESKWVNPLQSTAASTSTLSPFESPALKLPGVPSNFLTVVPVRTLTLPLIEKTICQCRRRDCYVGQRGHAQRESQEGRRHEGRDRANQEGDRTARRVIYQV